MILRKPYAFLIKHFKFIHLVLFGLFVYILLKANNMLSFFKDYINFNGNIEVIASNYFSYLILTAISFIIILSFVVYFLMRYKDKPRFLYIIIIFFSIVSLILFIFIYFNIRNLEISSMSGREVRLLRDLSRINYYLLFILSIPMFFRGLGFDIKKFNFSKDIADLKLESEDSEEVEVNVDLGSDSVKRTGRKLRRELKYYYIENKFIINIILVIIVIVLIFLFPFKKYVINRDLNEGEILNSNYFDFVVTDSFVSSRNRISKDNSYIIIKFKTKSNIDNYILYLDDFVLEGKYNKYIPSMKYYYYFNDIGNGYKNNILSKDSYKEYLFIYNIKNIDSSSGFVLNYLDSNKKIKLDVEKLD